MKSATYRHQHQRIPSSSPRHPSKPKPKQSRLSSSPPSPNSPQQRSVNFDLRTSNASGLPSSSERNRHSVESKDRFRMSDDDKSGGRSGPVGPEDSGYKVSTVPYHGPSSDGAKTASPPEDEKGGGSRNLKDNTRTSSSSSSQQQHKSPRKGSNNEALREAPTTPPSLTATGPRRYAPVRPSPLAQASYRNSTVSPSPSPLPPSTYAEKQPQQEPPLQHAQDVDLPPPFSPFGNVSDPFLEHSQQQQQHHYPQHHDYHYHEEDESDRPVSGVGYAI
jgi:hypothetical protein